MFVCANNKDPICCPQETDASVKFEEELRHQLTRQAAAHSDHLTEVLRVQENELHGKYESLLHERVAVERDNLRGELAGQIARLRGIEAAVEGTVCQTSI